ADRAERGLRDVRCLERLFLRAAGLVRESRMRVDVVAKALRAASVGALCAAFDMLAREHIVGFGQRLRHAGKLAGEVAQHPAILRALPGEQRAELAGLRAGSECNASGRGPR